MQLLPFRWEFLYWIKCYYRLLPRPSLTTLVLIKFIVIPLVHFSLLYPPFLIDFSFHIHNFLVVVECVSGLRIQFMTSKREFIWFFKTRGKRAGNFISQVNQENKRIKLKSDDAKNRWDKYLKIWWTDNNGLVLFKGWKIFQ